jgi:GPH family glycoside/pentoside/hexuronide:cation symporter
LIGYAIDHTHTRWGQSRPYFLWGAIPFAIFAYLAFAVPASLSAAGKIAWAYATYIGLSFMYTVVNIPMASILPSLTADPQERTKLATSRQFFAFLGSTLVSSCALKLVDTLGNGNDSLGFRLVMLIFGIVSTLIFFFTFFNVREINPAKAEKKASLKDTLKSLINNQPWKIFALNIVFMFASLYIQSSAIVYYYESVVGSRSLSVTVATIMSIVPAISNLTVPWLSRHTTKKKLFMASSAVQLAGIALIALAGKNVPLIYAGAIICGFAYGIKVSIYFSMQADPVDYGIWKTGVNTAGSMSAVNGFIGKLAQALAGYLGASLIAWGGYEAEAAVQSASAVSCIQWMYLYLPMIFIILSMLTMHFYKLDEIYPTIVKELKERNNKEESKELS